MSLIPAPNLSNVSGTLGVANGGTGKTSNTAYSVLCGGTTSTQSLQSVASLGTSGQVLTSNGDSALPTWQTPGGGFSNRFRAYFNSNVTNQTGDGTTFTPAANTTSPIGYGFNPNSEYNTSTGNFTAAATGYYVFTLEVVLIGLTSSHTNCNVFGTGTYSYGSPTLYVNPYAMSVSGTTCGLNCTTDVLYLASGEIFRWSIQVSGGTKVVGIQSSSIMSGYRVQ